MDVEIPLIIKASDQQFDDVKIQCNPEWTVLDLKNHLSVHYPSKPVGLKLRWIVKVQFQSLKSDLEDQ